MTTLRALLAAALVLISFGLAVAKLPPAPPMTDEQKAEKKAKDDAAAAVAKEQQTRAEDRVVSRYKSEQKAKGVAATPQMPAASTAGSVTTAQGNTPAGSTTGTSADATAVTKPGTPASPPATGPGAATDSSKK